MRKVKKMIALLVAIATMFVAMTSAYATGVMPQNSENRNSLEFMQGVVLIGLYVEIAVCDDELAQNPIFNGLNILGVSTLMEIDINHPNRHTSTNPAMVHLNYVSRIVAVYLECRLPQSVFDAIRILEATPGVAYAEPDFLMGFASRPIPALEEISAQSMIAPLSGTIPNNPLWSQQWGMRQIQAPQAWDRFTGSREIIVGIMDTGIDFSHPNLYANRWINPNPSSTKGYLDIHGWNFADNNNDIMDYWQVHGHGTPIAGVVGAAGNNGIGLAGVNWEVSLAALNVYRSDGTINSASFAAAVNYANYHGFHVINASFGTYPSITITHQQVSTFYVATRAFNGLFIASAGNAGQNIDDVERFPTRFELPNVITVGATDMTDNRMVIPIENRVFASNYGLNSVHLGAPGYNFLFASANPNSRYWAGDGTSFAAPLVAGAAALIMGYQPDLLAFEVKEIILESVDVLPQLENYFITGGRLNVSAAMELAAVNISIHPNYRIRNFTITDDDIAVFDITNRNNEPMVLHLVISRRVGNRLQQAAIINVEVPAGRSFHEIELPYWFDVNSRVMLWESGAMIPILN